VDSSGKLLQVGTVEKLERVSVAYRYADLASGKGARLLGRLQVGDGAVRLMSDCDLPGAPTSSREVARMGSFAIICDLRFDGFSRGSLGKYTVQRSALSSSCSCKRQETEIAVSLLRRGHSLFLPLRSLK
jgi:hypothetical protein